MTENATLDRDARFDRLDQLIDEGRLLRGQWDGRDDAGRETACLLMALAPEIKDRDYSPGACPAALMPQWLAELTPWIDDQPSAEHWPDVIRRYAALGRRWHVLTDDDWQRLQYRVRAIAVREAMTHTQDEAVLAACETSLDLCERAAAGEMADDDAWSAAWSAAASAAESAAASAAWSAAWSAAESAAASAAESAAWSAAESAAWSAAASAAASAADRMVDAALDAIEAAIVARESA